MNDLTWVRGGAIALGLAAIRRQDDLDAAVERMAKARNALEAAASTGIQREIAAAARALDDVRAEAAAALVTSHRAEKLSRIISDFAARAIAGDETEEAIATVAGHVRDLIGESLVVGAFERERSGLADVLAPERAA